MKSWLFVFMTLFCFWMSAQAGAVMHPDEKLTNPALEARALHLTRQLRCVVCQNESIEDSAADIARDLRLQVRKKILDGQSDAAILEDLRARYGDYILLNPPLAPHTYALWLTPALVLAAGIAFAGTSFRKRKKRR